MTFDELETVVKSAAAHKLVTLLPVTKREAARGCVVRFRMGTMADEPETHGTVQFSVMAA